MNATRRERLTQAQRDAGLLATVAADDPGMLSDRIDEQERLAGIFASEAKDA